MSQQSNTSFTPLTTSQLTSTQRLISPTLHLGVHYQADIINGKIYSLTQIPGDYLWGREGRYPVSFFLLEAVVVNNMVGKDFKTALIKLKEIILSSIARRSFNDDDEADQQVTSRLEEELVQDLDEYLSLSYPSDYIQIAIVEEVALRYMDIQTHRPLAFFEGPRADDKTIQQQREALSMLSAVEARLKNK
ncbi:predicted protein [Naegleria gruberi]|uniref:Predicted protein n=1 Tax=Naegleria gruberi TaxID=5762 RepID=D2V3P4_NAEGR|nr:uncharacterized protein NAEGRDRAFT_46437 [Naegleria gruberi]EFC48672.1 predicted protein [Naegleria gruberi]|eukprot:XP_002681416.1 predicted protein [Naegleria gruberi strain NEG-M]